MKLTLAGMVTFLAVAACTSQQKQMAACEGISELDIPANAILGQWRESELVEMRTGSATPYWVKRNHVLTREGQLTTREEICADEACFDPKAELTHFGTYEFEADKGMIQKSYRKHFYTGLDEAWMKASFSLEKCQQPLPLGEVVPLTQPECLDILAIKAQESWRLQGATLKSLALKNCSPRLRASSHLTRELVRMF
jgi:hypothetical protein